ncbi:PHP domain-containing protein [Nocardioides nematodiphilus]|uniref:PHP domain-containing protein n=1 Tax=Nocardioides nematodiphilus TaxID=2849669 RepID=UPI001CD95BFB|nr:PHP domain-containing protein [Nocardioides nematodiphilus]MCA1984555.1 PHP domain-containing protein [Nocardioides nematodiphilus]
MRIDLHTHSRVSDGTDTPAELVAAAAATGLDVVALTDHDTTAGWDEALAAGEEHGVTVIPGIEISTEHGGRSVHLLGYLIDPTYEPLVEELGQILAGRSARVPLMVAQLQAEGIAITEADVYAQSTDAAATGRPHVADALVALGVVGHRDEAFDRFLAWGRPAYVDRYAAPLERMIDLIARAGGVSVIAHPWGRTTRRTPSVEQLATFAARGLAGVEVDHQDHDAATRAELRAVAAELDLVATGSSDYHGTGKTGHPLGVNTTAAVELHRLLERAAAASAASGRPAPVSLPPVVLR